MTSQELNETTAILTTLLNALLGLLSGASGAQLATAKLTIGVLLANAGTQLAAGSVGTQLFGCFEQCRINGATRPQMDAIRVLMMAQNPVSLPAVAVAISGVYFSLVEQVQIVASTTFVSREDVDLMLVTMNNIFAPAEEFAADATDDPSVMQSLLAMHSASTRDLVARARPLPQMVTYSFNRSFPSLVLAQRIYYDPRRAQELVDENKTVHPAFMQLSGRCLSI